MNESETSKLAQTAVHLLSNYYQSRKQLAQFRQQMVQSFNESELRDLCLDLQINYDSLPGSGTGDKAREIMTLCLRQGRAKELFAYCQQARPNTFDKIQFPKEDTAVPEATTTAKRLHTHLTENVEADPYAIQTLDRLADQPESQTRRTALASLLTELLDSNEELVKVIRQAGGDQINQQVTLSDQAQAGDINMIGKVEGNMPEETFNKKKKKRWWQR